MPGYIIHIATATEYMKKHSKDIFDKIEFFNGVIAPDLTEKENKKNTHYGNSSSEIFLRKFLENNELNTDYEKGYFLHLVTDYIFYNKVIIYTSKDIYNDYDILNKYLIERYNVKIPDSINEIIKDSVFFKTGDLKLLTKELVEKTIELATQKNLNDIKSEILSTNFSEEWEVIKPLIRID